MEARSFRAVQIADIADIAVSNLNGSNAPGVHNVFPDMLKNRGNAVAEALHSISLGCQRCDRAQIYIRRDMMIAIPRKQAQLVDTNDYGPGQLEG